MRVISHYDAYVSHVAVEDAQRVEMFSAELLTNADSDLLEYDRDTNDIVIRASNVVLRYRVRRFIDDDAVEAVFVKAENP